MSLKSGRINIFVTEKCTAPKLSFKDRYNFFGHTVKQNLTDILKTMLNFESNNLRLYGEEGVRKKSVLISLTVAIVWSKIITFPLRTLNWKPFISTCVVCRKFRHSKAGSVKVHNTVKSFQISLLPHRTRTVLIYDSIYGLQGIFTNDLQFCVHNEN